MTRALLGFLLALYLGVAIGYLGRGERDRRTANDLVVELGSIMHRLEEHERALGEFVAQREAKATAALAECEHASERVAKQLEGCLFEKAGEERAARDEPAAPRALSGTAPFQESVGYPVPIPPKPAKSKE